MSKLVDERVVSMQFDNANFERNVSTSMSTLDKLKRALKLDGVGKGFDNISKAAKNVNMEGLGSAVDTVKAKFSALDVVGVTALANITNSAVNAGKNIVKAMTIDPVLDGFKEYELQMDSVQTILSNTRTKGTTIDDVNKALAELNEYADQTIYNFSQMTQNIGRFTAAGVDLDTSVASIKGLSNLAAVSGASANQASQAMYQLSQAIASGTIRLQDWISVENASMGGEVFQQALKRTAEHFGTNVDAMIDKYGTFRASLTEGGWLTTDVLTETLKQLSGAYTEADLIAQGYTESQAKEIKALADDALSAATEVKTFTQLWGTLKESVGSGWAQTWQLIIGDFYEAKDLLTGISDFFTGDKGIITRMSNWRNNLLKGALDGNPFSKLAERIEKVTAVTDKMTEATQKYKDLADKVILGDFGNGADRIEKLTKAGYDWAYVQNLVNEKLGSSVRHATDFKESQNGLNETQATTIEQLLKMSDAQLKNIGFTNDEIEAFRELEAQSKKTGIPMKDLLQDLDQLNGRTLLINSFKNAAEGLGKIFSSIGTAWRNIFPEYTSEQLYNAIAALHKFSTTLIMSDDTADKLTRTFQGLFSLLHLGSTILGGGLKIGLTILTKVLGALGLSILDVTAYIGDFLTAIDKFIFDNELVNTVVELMADGILAAGKAIQDFIGYVSGLEVVQNAISKLKDGLEGLKDIGGIIADAISGAIDQVKSGGLDGLADIGRNIIEGLKNGLGEGVGDVVQTLIDLGQRLIDAICGVLGIHSPSTVFFEIGQNIIEGLWNGLKAGAEKIFSFMQDLASKCIEFFSNVDWGSVISIAAIAGVLYVLNKFANGFEALTAPFEGAGKVLEGVGNVLDSTAEVIEKSTKKIKKVLNSFAKVLNANAFETRTEGIKNLAISIGILAASLYVLSGVDSGSLFKAVAAVGAMAVILGVLAKAVGSMSESGLEINKKGLQITGLRQSLIGIGVTILALAAVMKIVGSMDAKSASQGFIYLIGVMTSLLAFVEISSLISKFSKGSDFKSIGSMLLSMSAALLIMAGTTKLLSMMDASTINKGVQGILKFVAVFAAMALVSKLASGQGKRLGTAFTGMAVSIAIMAGVAKLLSTMDASTIDKGIEGILKFVGVFAAMAVITRLASSQKNRLGTALLSMSASLLIMVGVTKLLGMMSPEEIDQGIKAITKFVGIMAVMTLITRLGKKDMANMASTLVSMSIAIGVMAAISIALGLVKIENLAKGIVAVTMLGLVLSAMIAATRGATEVKGPLIAMTVAIGIMAGAVALLSLIDPARLATAAASLSAMMLAFGQMTKLTAGIKEIKMGSLATMLVVTGLLAAIVAAMSLIDAQSALPNTIALSTLMMAFAGSMTIVSKAGTMTTAALPGLAAMVGVTALLGTILGVMSSFDLQGVIPNAVALSTLLLALSAAMEILDGVGRISGNALGSMAILAAILGEIGLVLGIMSAFNVEASIPQAISLSILINALAVACGIISVVPFAGAVQGALGLASFIGIMAAVVTAAGALAQIPGFEWLIGEGGNLLQKLGESLGKFVGGLVGGVAAGATASLPEVAENLSAFATGIVPFMDTMKTMDASVLENVNSLAKAIMTISAGNFLDGITRFLGLGDGISGFATQASSLADAVTQFSSKTAGLSEDSVTKAKTAVDIVVALAKAADQIPNSGGWIGKIIGENDIGTFASQFGDVAKGISSFVSNVGNLDESAITKVQSACKVLSTLAKASQEIPNSGGWLGAIVGENDIDAFGSKLPALGQGISSFASSIAGIDESAGEKVSIAAKVMKELAKVAQEIPNSGGLIGGIVGDVDLTSFGSGMSSIGTGLTAFANSISGMPDDVGTKVTTAISVIKQLAELVNSGIMGGESGLFEKIGNFFGGGGNEAGVFGQQMTQLGQAIGSFADSIGTIDITSVTTGVNAIKTIATTMSGIGSIDTEVVGTIVSTIPRLGTALRSYSSNIAEVDMAGIATSMSALRTITSTLNSMGGTNVESINGTISAITRLTSVMNNMAGVNIAGVTSFVDGINKLAEANVKGVIQAFKSGEGELTNVGRNLMTSVAKGMQSGKSSVDNGAKTVLTSMKSTFTKEYSNFNNIGSTLIKQVASGISSGKSGVMSAVRSTVSSAASTLRSYYSSFHSAGSYVASGFAAGISSGTYAAVAKARAMASAAASAARAALDINSPSKVFYKIGDFTGQGFINALTDYADKSYKAGGSMADYARQGLSNAIRNVGDLLENGIDTQPRIRPVLDLSDIQSGTGSLRSMLSNSDFTIGSSGNINAISSMMRQNGRGLTNDDIVSELRRLRAGINDMPRNSYNINGITYDDGSAVGNAVSALIRAARIEGRV